MFELAFGADGIEPFAHALDMAHRLESVLAADLLLDQRGNGEQGSPAGAESLQEGGVLQFAKDARMEVVQVEELIEGAAQRCTARREKHRRSIEALREVAGIFGGQ